MGQARMNTIMLGKRMDLGFAVQLPETLRENNTVIIFMKRATRLFSTGFLAANPDGRQKFKPTHLSHLSLFTFYLNTSCQKPAQKYIALRHKLPCKSV